MFCGSAVLCVGCSQPSIDASNVTPAGTFSCALTLQGPSGPETLFCVQTSGDTVAQAQGSQGLCESTPTDAGGESWSFLDAGCPLEGAVVGCSLTTIGNQSVTTTQWYYDAGTDISPAIVDAGDLLEAGAQRPYCAGSLVSP